MTRPKVPAKGNLAELEKALEEHMKHQPTRPSASMDMDEYKRAQKAFVAWSDHKDRLNMRILIAKGGLDSLRNTPMRKNK